MTGTTAGRRSSHRGDFLVFLDDGQDIYATAPVKPGDTGYEIVTAKKEGTGISYQEVLNRMKAAKIAVMVGQPLGKDGIIDWSHSYHWVRPQQRSGYIRQFMRDFPECPLLRMHIGMRIFLISRMADRRKRMVTVVAIDRAFTTVRHDKSPQIPGSKCFEYPCTDKTHVHEDENVYRGSHRLEGAAVSLKIRRTCIKSAHFYSTRKKCYQQITISQNAEKDNLLHNSNQLILIDQCHREIFHHKL